MEMRNGNIGVALPSPSHSIILNGGYYGGYGDKYGDWYGWWWYG